jgi:hypothetical protein
LVDFIHVEQTVRRPFLKHRVLEVLTQHAGPLFVAAAKEVAAVVMVMLGGGGFVVVIVVIVVIVVLRHGVSSLRFL